MRPLQPVQIEAMDPRRFEPVISTEEYQDLLALIDRAAAVLQGRVIWNVNSTGTGGGVAELLRTLLGYSRGGGIDARWLVLSGDAAFFEVTKRIHNRLHGFGGDGRDLNEAERAIYEGTLAENAARLVPLIHPEDVVILHDPQTAGLVDAVRGTGAAVVWRCHVGVDHPNARVHEAWSFMRRYVRGADAYVFSRAEYAWDGLDPRKVAAIHPSIDPFSAKNQDQTPAQTLGILMRAGIVSGGSPEQATFTYGDATPGRIDRAATLLEAKQLSPSDRFIVQVSRWDELKDPLGVMAGFSRHIADRTDVHLVLAGPAADSVADDPEGAAVIGLVRDAWHALPDAIQDRVHVASLPMTDGESGVLLSDPGDLAAFGSAVVDLLEDHERAERMGVAARARIRREFLAPRHLGRHFALIDRMLSTRERERNVTVWAPSSAGAL